MDRKRNLLLSRSIVTFAAILLMLLSANSLACFRCKTYLGSLICDPGHARGGTGCRFEFDVDLGQYTCTTTGTCSYFDPPPWPISPYASPGDDDGAEEKICREAVRQFKAVQVDLSELSDETPTEIRQLLSALQMDDTILEIPDSFEGIMAPSASAEKTMPTDTLVDEEGLVYYEGRFLVESSGLIVGSVSYSGATHLEEVIFELSPTDAASKLFPKGESEGIGLFPGTYSLRAIIVR